MKQSKKQLAKIMMATSMLGIGVGTTVALSSCSIVNDMVGNNTVAFDKIVSCELKQKVPNPMILEEFAKIVQPGMPVSFLFNFRDQAGALVPIGLVDAMSIVFESNDVASQAPMSIQGDQVIIYIVKRIYDADITALLTDINSLKYTNSKIKQLKCPLANFVSQSANPQ